MKATIQNTSKTVELVISGVAVPARIWDGVTERGVKFHAFITRIAVPESEDQEQFGAELAEVSPPSVSAESYPLRVIL